ncbi:hypothetical protein N8813_03975 [bacterium]|nr:hypothetical protein [bacterium]MDB4657419.1 hypothetical protein [Verrucomicrobiales bacterium]MDC0311997.1 hypothetical protein [bacterium]
MKSVRFSKRKAVIVASLICLVFGIASWLASGSPYDFEVVSVTQVPGENMKVKFKFTNHSDEPIKLALIGDGIQSIAYIPVTQKVPKLQPARMFMINSVIRYDEKEVLPNQSFIIEDIEGIRKSGDAFIAMWQPPPSSDWFSNLRRKLDSKMFGKHPVVVTVSSPKTMKDKLREWLSPDPPKSLISEVFVVP